MVVFNFIGIKRTILKLFFKIVKCIFMKYYHFHCSYSQLKTTHNKCGITGVFKITKKSINYNDFQ